MTKTKRPTKLRHATDTGYQRGEETRARIIAAAIVLFGEHGFEGASTRDIASAAGVNAPALQYYFDNKEGVYTACVEHMVNVFWAHMGEEVMAGEQALAQPDVTDEALIDAFCAIQARKADFVETTPEVERWKMFMTREQSGLGPESAGKIMQERFTRRMADVSCGMVARLAGTSPDDEETRIRAICISNQGMAFRVMRKSVDCTMGWKGDEASRNVAIRRIVIEQTRDLLHVLVARRDARTVGKRAPRKTKVAPAQE